jgi:hypothetical protein
MDWERVGRVMVMVGVSGLLGLGGRLVAAWVRKRFSDRARRLP